MRKQVSVEIIYDNDCCWERNTDDYPECQFRDGWGYCQLFGNKDTDDGRVDECKRATGDLK